MPGVPDLPRLFFLTAEDARFHPREDPGVKEREILRGLAEMEQPERRGQAAPGLDNKPKAGRSASVGWISAVRALAETAASNLRPPAATACRPAALCASIMLA